MHTPDRNLCLPTRRSVLTLLGAAAGAALLPEVAVAQQGVRREDPSTWRWNAGEGPKIPGMEHLVLKSPSMDREVGYNVAVPDEYAKSKDRRFPVVYFLHGAGGNENSDAGGFWATVRKAMLDGKMPPVICVFPNGALSGYRDRPEQKVMGETLIIKELMPAVDARYRTVATREGRALAGFSMGGGGSIRLALKYPELFCAAGSWAGAMRGLDGQGEFTELISRNADKIRGKLSLLMIVGAEDQTFASHAPVIAALKENRIRYSYRVLPGVGHNLGLYYEQTAGDLMDFLGYAFKGDG